MNTNVELNTILSNPVKFDKKDKVIIGRPMYKL